MDAINDRCNCGFQIEHIFDGFFSCHTMKQNVIYSSKINGTSDKHTATELLDFIQDWVMTEGTFTVDLLQRKVSTTCSPLYVYDHSTSPNALMTPPSQHVKVGLPGHISVGALTSAWKMNAACWAQHEICAEHYTLQ